MVNNSEADDSAGTWNVPWDALPATLVRSRKTSQIPDEVGRTTEVKLIRVDDASPAVTHANQTVERYARAKK